ncbi:MAG: hypothetical protein U0939_06060 [Pirellulales bacterium]
MENGGSIVAGLIGLAAVAYLGYWLDRERRKRQRVLAVFHDRSDPLVTAVEELMLSGQLSAGPSRQA